MQSLVLVVHMTRIKPHLMAAGKDLPEVTLRLISMVIIREASLRVLHYYSLHVLELGVMISINKSMNNISKS